jgi:hypothetical protein
VLRAAGALSPDTVNWLAQNVFDKLSRFTNVRGRRYQIDVWSSAAWYWMAVPPQHPDIDQFQRVIEQPGALDLER